MQTGRYLEVIPVETSLLKLARLVMQASPQFLHCRLFLPTLVSGSTMIGRWGTVQDITWGPNCQ